MDSAPGFAHASEAELARILDYYQISWQYEARAFPIQWNLDGKVVESFAPDFYLPDLDLYVELTTLKQSLVRKKNRKLRRLRELYPEVRIKLLYARDFRALMLKYGRLALLDSLTGSEGQITPAHGDGDVSPAGAPATAVESTPAAAGGSAAQQDAARRGGATPAPTRGVALEVAGPSSARSPVRAAGRRARQRRRLAHQVARA